MPPEAAESHTHLAHAVIRYLGLTAPEELVPFGINDAAGIVDLISRVRPCSVYPFEPFSKDNVVCNKFYHAHFTIVGTSGRLRFSAGCAGQSFVRSERRRRIPAFRERSCKPRTGSASNRDTRYIAGRRGKYGDF